MIYGFIMNKPRKKEVDTGRINLVRFRFKKNMITKSIKIDANIRIINVTTKFFKHKVLFFNI